MQSAQQGAQMQGRDGLRGGLNGSPSSDEPVDPDPSQPTCGDGMPPPNVMVLLDSDPDLGQTRRRGRPGSGWQGDSRNLADDDLDALYDDLGRFCRELSGWRAGFLVANPDFDGAFGRGARCRPRINKPLSNASLRGHFLLYEL